jgi:multiple sugar transport system substrate-binding protein
MTIAHRFIRILTLVILLVGVLPALALGALEAAMAQDEAVELSFVGPEQPSAMEPVIAAFEAANPGITVNYESVPFAQLNDILQTRLGSGDATPDLFTADQPRIPALVSRGFLLDLTDEVGDISEVVLPSSIEASTIDGRLYALPVSTSTQLLYYNRDLLEQAGLTPPPADPDQRLTWEQVATDALTAQEAGAKWGFMFDQVSRVYQILPLPESLGGGNGVSGENALTPEITNEAWLKAADFYGKLFADGLAPRGVAPEQTPDLFANGEVAYFVGGPWWIPKFAGAEGLNYGIAPHPYFEGGEAVTPTGAWSWGINPNSAHQAEALAFIQFATLDTAGALETAKGIAIPPANQAALDQYLAQESFTTENISGVGELIRYELENTAVIRPRTVGFIQFEEIVGRALEDIRNGSPAQATLEAASQELATAWSRLD